MDCFIFIMKTTSKILFIIKHINTQERNGFETNSSSSHSYTIGWKKTTENLSLYKNTKIVSTGGSYGWIPDVLDTFKTKLDYICQASTFQPCLLDIVRNIIKKRLNSEIYFLDNEENYIDDESANNLDCCEEEIEKLLFMSDSYIYVLNNSTSYFLKNGKIYYLEDNGSYKYGQLKPNESEYGELQLVSLKEGVLFGMKCSTKNDVKSFIEHFKQTEFYEFVRDSLQ